MINRKTQLVSCKECKKSYQKRCDTLSVWSGICRNCHNAKNKLGKIYKERKSCTDCNKISYWIKEQERCKKCFIKYKFQIKENHPRWKIDRNLLKDDSKDRGGQLHREWSNAVKNRDSWKCKIANKNCLGRMESHHILSWKDYPELRYNINNGITLCHAHHPRKRAEEKNLAFFFQELINQEV